MATVERARKQLRPIHLASSCPELLAVTDVVVRGLRLSDRFFPSMVALVQRVSNAAVDINGETVGAIDDGILILLGVHEDDTRDESAWCAKKCANLRVFPDAEGKMDESLLDVGGEALVVPQFTLYGDTSKGNRPSFTEAAPPDQADRLYEHFVGELEQELGRNVPTGEFGALMDVHLTNDGPVTLWVERRAND